MNNKFSNCIKNLKAVPMISWLIVFLLNVFAIFSFVIFFEKRADYDSLPEALRQEISLYDYATTELYLLIFGGIVLILTILIIGFIAAIKSDSNKQ